MAHALPRARAGSSPRCAARASTPATRSAWRSTSGAAAHGNWSGCHAVAWDRNAPEFGDLAVGDGFQKHSLSLGHLPQRRGQALRRRGRGLPQLHLRQVRPRDPAAAGAVRLADLRRQGDSTCCATSTASSRSPRSPPTRSRSWSRSWTTSSQELRSRRSRNTTPPCARTIAVQSERQGRPPHRRLDVTRPTGRTRSTRRPSRPTRSPAASPSPSAA